MELFSTTSLVHTTITTFCVIDHLLLTTAYYNITHKTTFEFHLVHSFFNFDFLHQPHARIKISKNNSHRSSALFVYHQLHPSATD